MSTQGRIAVVFPGQGILDWGALADYQSSCRELSSMLTEVDAVGRQFGSASLTNAFSRVATEPPATDLLIFVTSLAAYMRLDRLGVNPHVILGHGFGEIAALVTAGAFSLAEGAEIVARRSRSLSAQPPHAMASIEGPAEMAAALIQLVKVGPVSIAAENSSRETILVGSERALGTAASLGRTVGIRMRRLKTTSSPHRFRTEPLESEIVDSLKHIRQRHLERAVFSPLKQRLYSDGDDLIGCLAKQLVEPLRFGGAVRQLVRRGVALFVECGPLHGLASKLDCRAITDDELARGLRQDDARVPFGAPAVSAAFEQEMAS